MKLSPSVLNKIAVSAGIAASVSAADVKDAKPAGQEAAKLTPMEVFKRFDTNEDRKLSFKEYTAIYNTLIARQEEKGLTKKTADSFTAKEWFDVFDLIKDGSMDENEYMWAHQHMSRMQNGEIKVPKVLEHPDPCPWCGMG